jgi:hypothetical protein
MTRVRGGHAAPAGRKKVPDSGGLMPTPGHPRREGENYETWVEDDGVARCRVWRRPDLDAAHGAASAAEIAEQLGELAELADVRGLILDIQAAPQIVGPRTQDALQRLFAAWERAAKPFVLLTGTSAVQRLQVHRLINEVAPVWGDVVDTIDQGHLRIRAR